MLASGKFLRGKGILNRNHRNEMIRMSQSYEIWPEDVIPNEVENCQKCSLAQQRSRIIWGEGNPDAPLFVLLDNPGAREDKLGNTFVCGTRQTLQAAVHSVGLGKNDLYITYVLRCRPIKKYEKDQCVQHVLSILKIRYA